MTDFVVVPGTAYYGAFRRPPLNLYGRILVRTYGERIDRMLREAELRDSLAAIRGYFVDRDFGDER